MQLALTKTSLVHCPRCEQWLPESEFGVCRARASGHNLYDRKCIREKINASRQALREYKAARVKTGLKDTIQTPEAPIFSPRRIARMLRKLSPADRVREAIRCGAHTQKEIAQVTKLPKDEVTDCIAELLLWERSIRTQIINQTRLYFIPEVLPERKPNKRAELKSFSSISALMPGRKRIA